MCTKGFVLITNKNKIAGSVLFFLFLILCYYYFFKPDNEWVVCFLPHQKFGHLEVGPKQMICGLKRCHYNEGFCRSPVIEKHVIKPLVILSKIFDPKSIIDIGSNIGIFSIYASELSPMVFSFDIQTDLNSLLSESSKKYNNIKVKNCGLGHRSDKGWTPDGFVRASGEVCDIKEVDFTDSIIKIDTDGNEEDVVNHALATSFMAMILEVTPTGWKKEPKLLMDHCDRRLCFLTETDESNVLQNNLKMHRSSAFNYIDSSVINSSVIAYLFEKRLVHNLIIINK